MCAESARALRLELAHLQLDSHERLQLPVEEQQVEQEVPTADLHAIVLADEREVATEFEQKPPGETFSGDRIVRSNSALDRCRSSTRLLHCSRMHSRR